MGRRNLTDAEVAAYDVLPPELARRVRLVPVPALPGGYAGLTLGRWVLLTRDVPSTSTSPLVAHELVHVRQWHELGIARFGVRYLSDFGRGLVRHRRWHAAYRAIGLEVAARAEADAWSRRSRTDRSGGQSGEALP